jgi:alkaline phosphatase
LILLAATTAFGQQHAKNVILFLGDAGGIPTLNAASIYGYKQPRALFLQHMPHIALSETSSANSWVTDSAAGMTAIVTGRKTDNLVLSQEPPVASTPGAPPRDGAPLKTILEYAEEHGLSTGVISNMSMADATPAACYAHVSGRARYGDIISQIWKPRFGDGVDVIIGNGRKMFLDSTQEMGVDLAKELRASGRGFYDSMAAIPADARRVVTLFNDPDFDVAAATAKAIQILSKNPKGYFLMVEWDLHPTKPERCLATVVKLDHLIQQTARQFDKDTLVIFTADHSFDFRLVSGKKGVPLALPTTPNAPSDLVIGSAHSGEEVLVAAQGPGSERVTGVLSNTDLFGIMLSAYGWPADKR